MYLYLHWHAKIPMLLHYNVFHMHFTMLMRYRSVSDRTGVYSRGCC
uniref:Uncharacterized protein n=1 Tax=Anguilla anguilla TaxID=7936 RepID=A0A0E9Q3G0_ANGAN